MSANFQYHPHHRSSEVFSSSVFGSTTIKSCDDSTSRDSNFDITMVRPLTIEDAIKRMQRVPSVEFACSLGKRMAENTDSINQHLNYSIEEEEVEEGKDEKEEEEEEEGGGGGGGDEYQHETLNREYYYMYPTYITSTIHHNSSFYMKPKENIESVNESQFTNVLINGRSIGNTVNSNAESDHPKSINKTGLCTSSVKSNESVTNTVHGKVSMAQKSSMVATSSRSLNSGVANNRTNNVNSPPSSISNATNVSNAISTRRPTVSRVCSDSAESEFYFVPKESWLTSLYVRLPKSKSFCRIQLELLNLPLFASVGRFLEETCTSSIDPKAFLEKNSFLFALFNQFVPHNRIPLNMLSKYIRRLQRYEIIATIEFNFLKTPSINRRTNSSFSDSICQQQQQQQQGQQQAITSKYRKGIHQSNRHRYAIACASSCAMRHALKPENQPKNNNQRYVPYDYNRVVLKNDQVHTDHNSDYINASHIDSLLRPNAYIVAQGTNENTIGHFWRMIWQQNVHVIVMLTKVYEFIRVMCSPYWPSALNKPEIIDQQFEVTLIDEDRLADYIVRTMKVRCLRLSDQTQNRQTIDDEIETIKDGYSMNDSTIDEGEYRTIYQLHFVSWNINSCPFSDSILKFRRRVQIYEKQCRLNGKSSGPLLVHCSNGCGRSGTYVCLDANLALAKEEGVVDIFNYAKALRKARVGMIDNLEQYKFIYETIEESHVCGKTWFHVDEISQQMKQKSIKNKVTKRNDYQNEFEKLVNMTSKFTIGDCAGGHRLENRDKNRDVSIVPPDNFRPYLTSFQGNEQTDYINAVFVDGYSRPREYIVTEWPLKKTIHDLWSLIYDHDCNTVVVLGGVPPDSTNAFPMFWPRECGKTVKYGPCFTVETISTNLPPNISSWVLRITKKVTSLTELMAGIKAEPKITQIFEFGAWPYDYKVPTSTNALVELIHMVERWRQRTSYGPVLVVSANGKARLGVYCAANFAIEQVSAHEEIDIFNAVKTVRRHRSALIDNVMEYKYCYDLTLHYVSHYMNNSNYNQIFRKNL